MVKVHHTHTHPSTILTEHAPPHHPTLFSKQRHAHFSSIPHLPSNRKPQGESTTHPPNLHGRVSFWPATMSVEVTEEELSRLHQKITDLNDETFDLRAEVTKLIESNSTLSTELERQTKTLVASQVAKETGGDDDKKKSRFTRFVDKVKDTKDMVEMQAEIDVLQAQVAQHESEAVRLQAMEMNTRHLQTFARESQLSISTLEESERKLKKQLAGMKDLVESKPELHDASAVADTKMQLDDALHSLAQKEADLTESAQRLVTTDEANLDLRRTVTQLQMDVDAWKKRSSSLDTALLEIERLTQAGDCLKIDSQAWKEQCQHLQKDLLERAETFEEKKREAQKQAENIASLQSQLEALSNEKALREQAELSLSDMSLKLQTVTSEAADNEKECARFDEVQSKATSLQNNVSSMKEALKIRDATIAKERVQNDALTERLKCETEKAAEADTLRAVIAERDIRDLVSACVDDAAFLAEQQTAAKLPALEESLSSCKAEAAYLQERAKEFDQKLSDLRSEHKIVVCQKNT